MNQEKAGAPARADAVPLEAHLQPDPDVVAERMDDVVILIHLGTNRIYELNPTGARFWELLASGRDLAAIQGQMLREFAVGRAALEAEIASLSAALLAEGLLRPGGSRRLRGETGLEI